MMRTSTGIRAWRAAWLGMLAMGVLLALPLHARGPAADALGSCVAIVASRFDAAGNDNANLNGEWIRIRNGCSNERAISGWRVTDHGSQNVYRFPSPFRLDPGQQVTLFSGEGSDTQGRRYWDREREVWNNAPPEFAYLRKPDGTLVQRYTEYGSASASPSGGPSTFPSGGPSTSPSGGPSSSPSGGPSSSPSGSPSTSPTEDPTDSPTTSPTQNPTPTYTYYP